MNRRDFLKTMGLMAGLVTSVYLAPTLGTALFSPELVRNDQVVKFRETRRGKILESLDGGETWDQAADFGPDCLIRDIRSHKRVLWAELEYKGFAFTIRSLDGRVWYSAG